MKTQIISGLTVFAITTASYADQSTHFESTGYVDFYYQASPQGHYFTTSGPRVVDGRYFDRHVNQMTLNMAEISLKKSEGRISFQSDLAFGEMVDQLSGGTTSAVNESTRNITQAFVNYAVNDRLSLKVGKFYTPMGFEVTKAKENWQYSRGYLFNYGIPFWHEGLSLSYVLNPKKMSATFYVFNAWDGRISQEQNESSTVGFNLNYIGLENLAINYNYLSGKETNTTGLREVHELNALYQVNEKYFLGVDSILGSEKKVANIGQAKWNAVAIYLKAAVTDNYTFSPRLEIFDDSDNGFAIAGGLSASGVKQKISSVTLANNFSLGDGLEARFELRTDKSNTDQFFQRKDGTGTHTQQSYTVALLYSL